MKLKSYCKINLFLEIVNRREDGYHNIRTLFQTVNLYDTLIIEDLKDNNKIIIESNIDELNNKNNLLWKVIEILTPHIPLDRKGIKIFLKKRIPIGAGLGGGSSNAATLLKGLNEYYQLNIDNHQLMEWGSKIGADVPFFIKGGIAKGEGIGSQVTYYDNLFCPMNLVIIYPNIFASTKEAYNGVSLKKINKPLLEDMLAGFKDNNLKKICDNLYNDFEKTQFIKYPLIKDIKEKLLQNGAVGALMSGSGSAVFGIFESEGMAKKAILRLKDNHIKVFYAKNI